MLQVALTKFITVYQPKIDLNISEKIVFANLSSYQSNLVDGKKVYKNSTWHTKFVGAAFEPAKALRNGDKINVINAIVENVYVKEKDREYTTMTVFEFEMSDVSDRRTSEDQEQGEADVNATFSFYNGEQ